MIINNITAASPAIELKHPPAAAQVLTAAQLALMGLV
jgi:hypothetical protein